MVAQVLGGVRLCQGDRGAIGAHDLDISQEIWTPGPVLVPIRRVREFSAELYVRRQSTSFPGTAPCIIVKTNSQEQTCILGLDSKGEKP